MYLVAKQVKISDLLKYEEEANNYGLCAKLQIKPIGIYDGDLIIKKSEGMQGETKIKVRVYDRLKTALTNKEGTPTYYESLILTPKSSFSWQTQGGPRPWSSIWTHAYLNDVKLQNSRSS